MKNIIILSILFCIIACKEHKPLERTLPPILDNAELQGIHDKD